MIPPGPWGDDPWPYPTWWRMLAYAVAPPSDEAEDFPWPSTMSQDQGEAFLFQEALGVPPPNVWTAYMERRKSAGHKVRSPPLGALVVHRRAGSAQAPWQKHSLPPSLPPSPSPSHA